jgi:hypothetical protein
MIHLLADTISHLDRPFTCFRNSCICFHASTPTYLLPLSFHDYQPVRSLRMQFNVKYRCHCYKADIFYRLSLFTQSFFTADTSLPFSLILRNKVHILILISRKHQPNLVSVATMAFLPRGNGALNVDPPTGIDVTLSDHGSDWLWAVTAIYIISFVRFTNPLS